MSASHGRFVWYELMTTDKKAAAAFYGDVVGWSTQDAPMPGMTYTMFAAQETPVAGLMDLPENARRMGAPPFWMGYVGVDDVDAGVAAARRLGGTVQVPPTDIPGIGRFAVVTDPQQATIALFKWADPSRDRPPAPGTPGRIGWHELMAADWEKALGFYGELFGWRKGEPVPIGDMGIYQLFTAGGPPIGGMFNKPPMVPVAFWQYYFNVGDIDAAAARVTKGGGAILNGPMQVPGGDWIVQAKDPQGVAFALVGRRG
ncbi:MAG: VOC family protein [Alphaproteobacteria bacterium]|nr:VOC family protein [Alphaproteobacteria bacterium]